MTRNDRTWNGRCYITINFTFWKSCNNCSEKERSIHYQDIAHNGGWLLINKWAVRILILYCDENWQMILWFIWNKIIFNTRLKIWLLSHHSSWTLQKYPAFTIWQTCSTHLLCPNDERNCKRTGILLCIPRWNQIRKRRPRPPLPVLLSPTGKY